MLRGTPPLSQMNDTADEADTKTDKGGNDEQQKQGLSADAGHKGGYPGYRLGYYRGNIAKYGSHRTPPLLQVDDTPDKTDAQADKGHNHEQEQKRVTGDCTSEGADPAYGGRDNGRNGRENRGNSYSSSSMKASLQIILY